MIHFKSVHQLRIQWIRNAYVLRVSFYKNMHLYLEFGWRHRNFKPCCEKLLLLINRSIL